LCRCQDRGREAQPTVFGRGTLGNPVEIAHEVNPHRRAVDALNWTVQVNGEASGPVGAQRKVTLGDGRKLRLLADLIDYATG
jgi:hypothetical protein